MEDKSVKTVELAGLHTHVGSLCTFYGCKSFKAKLGRQSGYGHCAGRL